jgi:hypothetical protein
MVDIGSDYSAGLAEIGQLVFKKITLYQDFVLTHSNIDVSSIEVSVDSATAEFEYESSTNEVHISEPGTALSEISINYCLNNPSSEPNSTDESTASGTDGTCANGGTSGSTSGSSPGAGGGILGI